MNMCEKCTKVTGWLVLIVGVLFILTDLKVGGWNFWGLSWWSVVLTVMGLTKVCSSGCVDCKKARK